MANHYIQSMLGENERILLVTRQHWFVLFRSILLEIIVIIGILVFATVAFLQFPPAGFSALLVILPLLSMYHDIMAWNNHEYIVTNRRVIQFSGIINKKVVDSSLEKVNDVQLTQSALGRIFDYGDVEIMTASELGVNVFRRIGDPVKFKTAMLNAREKLGFEGVGAVHASPAESIPQMIAELDELRKKGVVTEEEFQLKKKELLAKM